MNTTNDYVRTGLGVLVETSPEPPAFGEIVPDSHRPTRRALAYGIGVVALTLVMTIGFAVVGGQFSLAYAMDPGLALDYRVVNLATTDGETIRTEANLGYEVESLIESDNVAVVVSFAPDEPCDNCLPPSTFTQVVAGDGRLISVELPEGVAIPEFVLPTPIPYAGVTSGLPLFIGPPLPDGRVGVGDQWTTYLNGIDGSHRLTEETEFNGHRVVVIESSYSFIPESGTNGEPITASTTVWFDPENGIVIRAEMVRNETSPTIEFHETTYELVD
jgi:hypothetical protein